ncbi:hypothetical protein BSLG_001294 [Batrachochytrium salamandrivorans]|nr:hypothetical protein BASA81_007666 [Batrachochytrium salamandrivorans]KAJ1344154.1 hypothetical protein BSLG_001294 [Batrachochytrium salamandrivorans]
MTLTVIPSSTLKPTRRYSYSAAEKLKIIRYAEKSSQGQAAFKYGVHKSMISRWVRILDKIKAAKPTTRRIGSGRRPWKRPLTDDDDDDDFPTMKQSGSIETSDDDGNDDEFGADEDADACTLVAGSIGSGAYSDGWESSPTLTAIPLDRTRVAACTPTAFLGSDGVSCKGDQDISPGGFGIVNYTFDDVVQSTVTSPTDTLHDHTRLSLSGTPTGNAWIYPSHISPTNGCELSVHPSATPGEGLILGNTCLFEHFDDDDENALENTQCRLTYAIDNMFTLSKDLCI